MQGKRCVTFQEPDDNSMLNGGTIKKLTGGKSMTARGLYSAETNFESQ